MERVVMSSIISVFSALTLVALVNSQKAIQEGCWRHESSFDDVTSPTTALWVQDVCVSKLRCIALCSSRSTCNAVFHDPISAQCQGHRGFVMAKNTRPKTGTTFFIRNSRLRGTSSSISSNPPRLTSQHTETTPASTPKYHIDHDNKMEYYVYQKKLTWLDAEAFCEDKGERLIRLDTAAKRKSVRQYLASKKEYKGEKANVAGYIYSKDDMYWESHMKERMPMDIVKPRLGMAGPMTLVCIVKSYDTRDKLQYRAKKAMVAGYRYDEDAIYWGSNRKEPVPVDILVDSLLTNKVSIYGCYITSEDVQGKLRITKDRYDGELIICERNLRV